MTRIETLGQPHASLPYRQLGPGKAVALLTFLSAALNRCAPRREVFSLLYSENSPRDADAFRQLLASLRKTLPGIFVTTNDLVSLAEPLESDRQQFLDACTRGDDETALALYQHEFFDPFDEPGCEGFLRWAHEERLRLRRRFEVAAESLVRKHLSCGDWTAALAVASDVAERFPALQVSLRLLIETLTLAGRGDEIRTILGELGVPRQQESPAQRRALDRLLDDVDALALAGALASPARPLAGRTREFRTVLDAWSTARTGAGGAMLIDGPTDIGKTRLLANLALRLRLDSPAVIRYTAAADEGSAPLTTLHHLARNIMALPGALGASPQHYVALRTLAANVPSANDVDDDERRVQLVDAFADGLRAVGEEAAVAVLIDDLDRASRITQHVVSATAARLRTARVLLVITSRASLSQMIDASSRYRLTLGPLDRDSTAHLHACATGSVSTELAEQLHDETDGVPGRMVAALDATAAQMRDAQEQGAAAGRRVTGADAAAARGQETVAVVAIPRRRVTRVLPIGTLVAAGVLFTIFALQKARAFVPPESFSVFTWHGDSVTRKSFTIGDTDTTALSPLFEVQDTTDRWPLARIPDRIRISPDGSTLAAQTESDGLNTSDIFGVRGNSTFAIATGPRDDANPDWSPDGALVAFSTNRWADAGNEGCDIAVRNIQTADIWRMTEGVDCDVTPRWNLRGDGIGFLRGHRERNDSVSVCTLVPGKGPVHCSAVDSTLQNVELLDWRTTDEMLISASRGDQFAIYAMQLPAGQTRRLFDDLIVMQAELSPSRRYLACWCSTSRDSTQRITVLDLSGARPLLSRGASMSMPHRHIAWNAVVPTAYRDSSARRLALVARHSSTMAAARSASDELRSQQTGPADTLALSRAKMRAAAPELARAGARLSFPAFTGLPERQASDSLLFDEAWANIDTVRWRSFGAPRPRIGLATEGLDPGGDGSYPSGLYTRRAFTAPRGLVFDAIISVPVSLPYWQGLTLTLVPEALVNGMQKWNHVTGTWDQVRAARPFETGIQYPALEGATRATSFGTSSGGTSEHYAVSPAMGDGRDVALRVSLGPDSLMTVFINGQQYAQRRYTPTPNGRYHLMIMGHSAETKVRLRRLRVWRR